MDIHYQFVDIAIQARRILLVEHALTLNISNRLGNELQSFLVIAAAKITREHKVQVEMYRRIADYRARRR